MERFSVRDSLLYGWRTFQDALPFFVGIAALILGISFILGFVSDELTRAGADGWSFAVDALSLLVAFAVEAGFIALLLSVYDRKQYRYKNFSVSVPTILRYIAASVLYALIVLLGLVLLVVPGLVWAVTYGFYGYAVVDKGLSAAEALSYSRAITKGKRWRIFALSAFVIAANMAGMMFFGIGLLITIPITALAWTRAYRALSAAYEHARGENEPAGDN